MVEGSGLENRQAFTRLEGSNPSLSAKIPLAGCGKTASSHDETRTDHRISLRDPGT